MSTQAQAEANKANAQHSTGPKSETGKAASSQNNFRHGFTGQFKVLDWERQEDFVDLLARFCVEHQPSNECEIVLVERIAQHFWLAGRALRLQEQCFRPDLAMKEADDECTGRLVPVVHDQEKTLALYLRYQTTHDRAFRQVSDELRKLRNEKRKQERDEAALSQRAEDSRIGFESQQAKQAQEVRKQEMHEARVRLVNSKADHNEIDNDIRQTIEAPLPGHMRLPFDTLKKVFSTAVDQVNREAKAAEAA